MPSGDFLSFNPIDVHVGSRAQRVRLFRGVNLFRLANFLKIEPDRLALYESGSLRFPADCLLRLCEALDTTPSFLFSGLRMSSYPSINMPSAPAIGYVNDNSAGKAAASH
jgi:transcriptional regulator with XRE-family HTH domain